MVGLSELVEIGELLSLLAIQVQLAVHVLYSPPTNSSYFFKSIFCAESIVLFPDPIRVWMVRTFFLPETKLLIDNRQAIAPFFIGLAELCPEHMVGCRISVGLA